MLLHYLYGYIYCHLRFNMYTLTLNYKSSTTSYIQDVNTFAFATDLLLRGIYCEQPSDNTLVFSSQSDLAYATLAYSGTASLAWD